MTTTASEPGTSKVEGESARPHQRRVRLSGQASAGMPSRPWSIGRRGQGWRGVASDRAREASSGLERGGARGRERARGREGGRARGREGERAGGREGERGARGREGRGPAHVEVCRVVQRRRDAARGGGGARRASVAIWEGREGLARWGAGARGCRLVWVWEGRRARGPRQAPAWGGRSRTAAATASSA